MQIDRTRTFVVLLAVLLSAGHAAHALAQSAANSAAAPDQRTERRQVRTGCSVMVRPDNKTQLHYSGGSCTNGLLEGIVKSESGDRVGLIQFQEGKELRQMSWKVPTKGSSTPFSTLVTSKNGIVIGGTFCSGKTDDEGANSHPRCLEALRIFGHNPFDGSGAAGNQAMAGAGYDSSANTGASVRDDPKVLGGAYRP